MDSYASFRLATLPSSEFRLRKCGLGRSDRYSRGILVDSRFAGSHPPCRINEIIENVIEIIGNGDSTCYVSWKKSTITSEPRLRANPSARWI